MKVKFNVGMAGPGFRAVPGSIHDRPDAEAKRLIAAGIASAVDEPEPKPEPKTTRRTSKK